MNIDDSAPLLLELKGATIAAVRLRLPRLDLEWLGPEIERALGSAPDFFDSELAVIDLAGVADDGSKPDWPVIADLLFKRGLALGAVANASGAMLESARSAGLALVSLPRAGATRSAQAKPAAAAENRAQHAPDPGHAHAPTLIRERPVRSGQQIYGRGGDVVLLAQTSAGSEVIADGSIHVYGPLRGRALAGAHGNPDVRIFSTCFEAELVSIAGVYRTFEAGVPAEIFRHPAQVRLVKTGASEPTLLIQPLNVR